MSSAPASVLDGLAAVLRGEEIKWSTLGGAPETVVDACAQEGVTALVYERLQTFQSQTDWPIEVVNRLAASSRAGAASELLRRRELVASLDALADAGVVPLLLKGLPLAYTLYDSPVLRTRSDTDLLIRRDQVDTAKQVLTERGYSPTPFCDGELLFCQFELWKSDEFGVVHALDVHWKISTQPIFADLLTHDELARTAMAVPPLGPHASAPAMLHLLLLGCIHPVMHHRNAERLIWIWDLHLMASALPATELERFAEIAVAKGVAAICARELKLARRRFGTKVADSVLARLDRASGQERSAEYLDVDRKWRHELVSSLRALPRVRDRLQLLREVVFPSRQYMLDSYGVRPTAAGATLLPALYLHRMLNGAWKAFAGRK